MVHSTKHYVQFSRGAVSTVSRDNLDIAKGVESTTANAVDEVAEGSTIKACYIELWLLNSGNDGSNIVVLSKNTQLGSGPTFSECNALGTWDNKKNILYTHQGLDPNDGIANPMIVMGGWYKIPKSKQRFGLGDSLVLTICNNSLQDLFFCGFSTYKEYT